jgi:hypothetical protein
MATRKNMRKQSKSRKAGKASKANKSRKTRKNQAGGKRSEWLQKVMRVYKEMKAKNPTVRLGDAMRAAKKMQ